MKEGELINMTTDKSIAGKQQRESVKNYQTELEHY